MSHPSVTHLVVTDNFAGTERYVCDVANETVARGWDVAVVGGQRDRMMRLLRPEVTWRAGRNAFEALRSIARGRRRDIVHAHMTLAEAVAVATQATHRGRVVTTRHFASPRGSSMAGRLTAPAISHRIAREIAISEFVAEHLERPPDAVLHNGVPETPTLWSRNATEVLVLQRLEREKDTATAIHAWQALQRSPLVTELRVVGEGAEREGLERLVAALGLHGVTFVGAVPDVSPEFRRAAVLLATAPAEPFGLAVLEAMAAGVPVIAADAGGHRETVGRIPGALMFPSGDAGTAARMVEAALGDPTLRARLSAEGVAVQRSEFSLAGHVDRLLVEYESAGRAPISGADS